MSLQRYREKRNFHHTPEPRGKVEASSDRLRYVVQKHAASHLHYDFRLELDGTLKSWAVPKGPSLDPGTKRLAMHVEDHPLEYASFEGTIPPKQYGAGTVLLWDRGYWTAFGDPRVGYRTGRLKFRLEGQKLHGFWSLVRMGGRGRATKESWLLIKEKDEAARKGNGSEITQTRVESVDSGRTIEQIATGPHQVWRSNRMTGKQKTASSPPSRDSGVHQLPGGRRAPQSQLITPQLATLADQAPVGEQWVHELKYDGYRIVSRVKQHSAQLFTRNQHDWTSKLQQIADTVAALPVKSAWFDGEVIALRPDGTISFQALQNAFETRSQTDLVYYVFDLLYLNGYDLTQVPLLHRKQALAAVLQGTEGGVVRYSDHIVGAGQVVFEQACHQGMEGIVSKRIDGLYHSSRNRNWIKVKCGHRQEFVIGGFTEPGGSRVSFGALLLGVYDAQGTLRFVGRTGTGFSERSLQELHKKLGALEQPRPPFANPPTGLDARGVHWVKPRLVAEVSFAEWTQEGLLRQAAFQGLREDKPPKAIIKEEPKAMGTRTVQPDPNPISKPSAPLRLHNTKRKTTSKPMAAAVGPATVAGMTLSHPDRLLYPDQGLTKLALARYYEHVSTWLLPHLQDRPLTLVRCPEGFNKDCFYQKHANDTIPDTIDWVQIHDDHGKSWYMIANSLPAVIGLVQMGVLELHTWGAKQDALDRPDRLIMDLDPDPTVPWKFVVEGAHLVKTLLNELELECFVKTTGGKGLHVVVPLQRVHTWDEVKAFSKGLADHLVRLIPDRFVANMSKRKRHGKIYIDYLRNARGATAIAAFSTRARAGAPVSVPLAWKEVSADLRSDHFTVSNVLERLKRLKQDPWRDYCTTKQKLTRAMKASLEKS
jgi:bifunctional non-homologous end joining protein LigD